MPYNLEQFLDDLFGFCDSREIKYCFARNYKDLPNSKTKEDLDLIVSLGSVAEVVEWLDKLDSITVSEKIVHSDVINLLISGVSWQGDYQVRVNLLSNLSWKGIPFLPNENVLLRSTAVRSENKKIRRPDPLDEMIMSFFSQVINSNEICDKDWKKWRTLAEKKPQAVRDKFKRRLGEFYSNALVNYIDRDDRDGVLKNKNRWKYAFIKFNWEHEGLHMLLWVVENYYIELKNFIEKVRKSPTTVFILEKIKTKKRVFIEFLRNKFRLT